VLFRSLIEYLDTISAAMCDVNVFKSYIFPSEDYEEQYKNWRKNLAPKKVKNILKKYESGFGLDPDVMNKIHDMRDDTYHWLSQFTHASWPAQVVSAFGASEEVDIKRLALDEFAGSKYLLTKLCVYLNYFGMLLSHQLKSCHGWSIERDVNKGFFTKSAVLNEYFMNVYQSMLDDVAE
jgi:hypothetical protein